LIPPRPGWRLRLCSPSIVIYRPANPHQSARSLIQGKTCSRGCRLFRALTDGIAHCPCALRFTLDFARSSYSLGQARHWRTAPLALLGRHILSCPGFAYFSPSAASPPYLSHPGPQAWLPNHIKSRIGCCEQSTLESLADGFLVGLPDFTVGTITKGGREGRQTSGLCTKRAHPLQFRPWSVKSMAVMPPISGRFRCTMHVSGDLDSILSLPGNYLRDAVRLQPRQATIVTRDVTLFPPLRRDLPGGYCAVRQLTRSAGRDPPDPTMQLAGQTQAPGGCTTT
jgi:hypothetical protein